MTWKEFKDKVELCGAKDATEIFWIGLDTDKLCDIDAIIDEDGYLDIDKA